MCPGSDDLERFASSEETAVTNTPPGSRFMKAHQRRIREDEGLDPSCLCGTNHQMASTWGCTVREITKDEATPTIQKYEWLVSMGFNTSIGSTYFYGMFAPNGTLLGVECFGRGTIGGRSHTKHVPNPLLTNWICLERGACVFFAPRRAASFLIKHACRLGHAKYGWEVVYAYADEAAGEKGSIYQICKWQYLGKGVGRNGKGREAFTLDGKYKSSKSMRTAMRKLKIAKGQMRAHALTVGWLSLGREYSTAKHKYVQALGPNRESILASLPNLPYPAR